MEIEKTIVLPAEPEKVWGLLLDPDVMAECVPGMQSVEIVSPVEYRALIKVKISFISAKFKIKTLLTEQNPPLYLKAEGSGDDASAASSFRQTSEMFLEEAGEAQTRMRIVVRVQLLGRLGTFGLNVMKTKADRMWDEFGENLLRKITGDLAIAPESSGDKAIEPAEVEPLESEREGESDSDAKKWWKVW